MESRQQKQKLPVALAVAAEGKRKTNLSWQLISQEMTPADREAFKALVHS